MTWKIRHEGSPQSIEGLTLEQVVEGLQDGLWEPTDEVMGPDDAYWVALENHPQFAELAMDLEIAQPKHYDDETRLDMNPLIDVCLVLLIFFILTTSYAALQKVLDMPNVSPDKPEGALVIRPEQVKELMVKVEARKENGQTVLRVEDHPVAADDLVAALRSYVKAERKTEILLDAADVDWGTVVLVQDAAKGAGMQRVHFLDRPKPAPPK
jgi:biopolymer transport protein ExbD